MIIPTQSAEPSAGAQTLRKASAINIISTPVAVLVLLLWLVGVVFVTTKHEFWRDEVRALSLTQAANSPLDLYDLLKQREGHPMLWYLLLHTAKSVINSPLVLPIISVLIAFLGVAVFLFFSPFPFWFRCIFIFGLPFYEYSVMARNYGISMLLLFVAAAIYPKRAKHSLLLGTVLALLANTNIHSAIFVALIIAMWIFDAAFAETKLSHWTINISFLAGLVIALAGLAFCASIVAPNESSIATSTHSRSMGAILNASLRTAFHLPTQFPLLVPYPLSPWMTAPLLVLAVLGLCIRPLLAAIALAAQTLLGLVFYLTYWGGSYRHQGLFLVFLVVLYWLLLSSATPGEQGRFRRWLFYIGLYAGLLLLILGTVRTSKKAMQADVKGEMSSGKALGQFINSSVIYRGAIVLPEPDYLLEPLPYYSSNRIYFPREHRFGTTVLLTKDADVSLSLNQLLSAGRELKASRQRPVLIVLGHENVLNRDHGRIDYSYNKTFSWEPDEVAEFKQSTARIAIFDKAYTDENYSVYVVK